jgi:hypothetical protein
MMIRDIFHDGNLLPQFTSKLHYHCSVHIAYLAKPCKIAFEGGNKRLDSIFPLLLSPEIAIYEPRLLERSND